MTEFPHNKRQSPRAQSFARVILESMNIMGYLSDLSPEGFRVRTIARLDCATPAEETVGIQFEEIGLAYFRLTCALKWKRDEANSTLLGYEISGFENPEGAASYDRIRMEYERAVSSSIQAGD